MLAPSSEGAFYCLRSDVSDACPFLNPICLLPQWASCPWEDPAPAGEGGRAYPLWQEGLQARRGSIGSGADELSGRCVAIAEKHQGSSVRMGARLAHQGSRSVSPHRIVGERRHPVFRVQTQVPEGWPWWHHAGAASHPSPCTGTRQRAGEGQKGKWAGIWVTRQRGGG